MKINLIGYGKMGKMIAELSPKENIEIENIINSSDDLQKIAPSEIAIDFSTPKAFLENYELIAQKFNIAIVGTTGWSDQENLREKIFTAFQKRNKTLIYASNFSIGVNIFYQLVTEAAQKLARFGYDPFIVEMHHKHKKDRPSGTALTIKELIQNNFVNQIPIESIRAGEIKGIHEVGFVSENDRLLLKHEAFSREGFASGALLAAKLAQNLAKPAIMNFGELIKFSF